ncbi:MAG TPA: hypothetical protein VH637_00480 [Streptosporangiaceae bacterium]
MVAPSAGLSVLSLLRPAPAPLTEKLPVDVLAPAYSPRLNGVDQAHVQVLAEVSSPLPPILVQHGSLRVVDGMHRLCAARMRGEQTIEAEFFHGCDKDAFLVAVEANISHGLPLSMADRLAAASRIVMSHPERSDRAIAELTGLAHKTVARLRTRLTGDSPQSDGHRVGRDGRMRPVSAEPGRRRAAEVIAQRPRASLRQIAAAAKVSVETARDVRARLDRGEDPARTAAAARPRPASQAGGCPRWAAAYRNATAAEILRKLALDPSLRTDAGRQLLRWMHQYATPQDGPRLALELVPRHCAPALAVLARKCASSWVDLARQLEQLAQS